MSQGGVGEIEWEDALAGHYLFAQEDGMPWVVTSIRVDMQSL